jgi:outer membrane protein
MELPSNCPALKRVKHYEGRMMSGSVVRNVKRAGCAAAASVAVLSTPALAQSGAGETKPDLIITIGGGAQVIPRFPGSDKVQITPMPVLGFRKDGEPLSFGAADQGFGIDLSLGKRIAIGPVVQLQSSRRDKDVGAAVGKVPFTVEAGAFVQGYLTPYLRLRAEARRGVGGHDAWVGDVSADFVARDADRTIFSIGPRLRISDAKYQRAYFGVTPAAAVRTGLAVYRPDGGIHAVGVSSSLTHQFNFNWGVRAFAGYDRLVGNGGDSPLVRRFGDRNQYSAGLGLSYSFRYHRGSH